MQERGDAIAAVLEHKAHQDDCEQRPGQENQDMAFARSGQEELRDNGEEQHRGGSQVRFPLDQNQIEQGD